MEGDTAVNFKHPSDGRNNAEVWPPNFALVDTGGAIRREPGSLQMRANYRVRSDVRPCAMGFPDSFVSFHVL